jgi:hypothetical protein
VHRDAFGDRDYPNPIGLPASRRDHTRGPAADGRVRADLVLAELPRTPITRRHAQKVERLDRDAIESTTDDLFARASLMFHYLREYYVNDLCELTVAAMRLQNLYALALDSRNVEMFRSVFTPDAVLVYPPGTPYTDQDRVDGWLTHLARRPVGYRWWQHAMLSHTSGWETETDRDHAWAVCYGFCRVIREDNPEVISVSHAVYRDRLVRAGDAWKISHRTASLLMKESVAVRPGQDFLRPGPHIAHSMLDDEVGAFQ